MKCTNKVTLNYGEMDFNICENHSFYVNLASVTLILNMLFKANCHIILTMLYSATYF